MTLTKDNQLYLNGKPKQLKKMSSRMSPARSRRMRIYKRSSPQIAKSRTGKSFI